MIALHVLLFRPETLPYIQRVISRVLATGESLLLTPAVAAKASLFDFGDHALPAYSEERLRGCRVMIVMGGDGTILDAVTHVRDTEVPLMGINLGNLGFLSNTAKDEIDTALDAFFSGNHSREARTLLQLKGEAATAFSHCPVALNECVVFRNRTSMMIRIECYVDDYYVGTFQADGLIVATPTGSTAYALSSGGPISTPDGKHFILAPISPHNLSARPLVIPDTSRVTLQAKSSSSRVSVSLDARAYSLPRRYPLLLEKASFPLYLIRFEGGHFFETLRKKMHWGVDIRKRVVGK